MKGGSGKPAVLVGCCGFAAARSAYFRELPLVEVQQTFYQPPRVRTLERWRAESPSDFVFTIKAWQLVTHEASSPTYRRLRIPLTERERKGCGAFKPTEEVDRGWEATLEAARILASPVVLFQTPARFLPSEENLVNLRRFFRGIERAGLNLVFEPRGPAWAPELVRGLCEELDLIHGVDPFVARPARAPLVYYRLHGVGGYRHPFTEAQLDELIGTLSLSANGFALFNNISTWDDARSLWRKLGGGRGT